MTGGFLGLDRPLWIMIASVPFWALMNLGMASGETWTTVAGGVPVAAFCVWALQGAGKALYRHILPAVIEDVSQLVSSITRWLPS